MLYQGVPLESKAAPNTDAVGNKVCFTVLKGAGIPTHEEICPAPSLVGNTHCEGSSALTFSGTAR